MALALGDTTDGWHARYGMSMLLRHREKMSPATMF